MPSLQIRELPRDVYEMLAFRAEREGRSLAQQAITELRKIRRREVGDRDARKAERGSARRSVLARIALRSSGGPRRNVSTSPEEMIREDRGR